MRCADRPEVFCFVELSEIKPDKSNAPLLCCMNVRDPEAKFSDKTSIRTPRELFGQ